MLLVLSCTESAESFLAFTRAFSHLLISCFVLDGFEDETCVACKLRRKAQDQTNNGSLKEEKKMNQQNNETSVQRLQFCGDEENGREYSDSDRPGLSLSRVARQTTCKRFIYFKYGYDRLVKARRKNSYTMSSSANSNESIPANTPGQTAFHRVKELFLHFFSERFSGLDESYDPEVSINPLSDEEIEDFRYELSEAISLEENHETGLYTELVDVAEGYLESTVFSYINDNISNDHFLRTFARIVKALWYIRVHLRSILLPFQFAASWGDEISEHCINTIYTQYGTQLVSFVLQKMRERRQAQNNNSERDQHYLFEIAKYFESFEDDEWKNPYIQSVLDDTKSSLESFDLQPNGVELFEKMASDRARKEAMLASSFRLGGTARKEAFKHVHTAFSQRFEEFVIAHPEQSLQNHLLRCIQPPSFEQADADKFYALLIFYGKGDMWNTKREELKNEIIARGNTMVQACRVANNNWDMGSLTVAVQNFAKYDKCMREVFQMPTNRLPQLRQMIKSAMRYLFEILFDSEVGRKPPEEVLADFVEHVAMRTEASRTWRRRHLGYAQTVMKYLSDKDIFVSDVERKTKAHDPRNIHRRNETFLDALQAMSRVAYVPPELIDSVREACAPYLSARQWASTRPDVIYTQYTMRTAPPPESPAFFPLTDIEIDSLMLYTVAVAKFGGQRHTVFIRMTRMQLEVFSFVMQYGRCDKYTIEELVTRCGVFTNPEMAEMTAQMVVDSLRAARLVSLESTDDDDFVKIENPSIESPYVEVGPINVTAVHASTDIKFLIDNAIVEHLEEVNSCTTQQLFEALFGPLPAITFDVVQDRIRKLEMRNYVALNGVEMTFVPFAGEESSASAEAGDEAEG